MKTTFILHGGESSRRTENNETFFKEIITRTKKDKINILCIYFARPEHRWQESFYEDRTAFEDQGGDKSLYIELASREEFLEQLKWTDVVFINGGFQGFLKDSLEEIENLPQVFENKIVVGISAGANILSKYYYSQGAEDIKEGIGLLPIKVFCHYSDGCTSELSKLEEYKESLPVYKIPEEKYVVIEE